MIIAKPRTPCATCKPHTPCPACRARREARTGDSPVAFVWSLNGTRRQLSKSQLAMIAVKMLEPLKAEAKKRQQFHGGTAPGKSLRPEPVEVMDRESGKAVNLAAKLVGVGKTVVQEAKAVMEQSPELARQVESGKISVDRARDRRRLDHMWALLIAPVLKVPPR